MKNCPTTDLESCLKGFVSWSLEQSYSNPEIDANLQILNCAWEAQKMLWELRHSSPQETVAVDNTQAMSNHCST